MTGGASLEMRAREAGVETTGAVAFERSYWPHRKLRDLHSLREVIRTFKPDVIHSHLTHDHLLAGVANGPKDRAGALLVRTWHRESPPRCDALTRGLVRKRTAGMIGVSSTMVEALRNAFDPCEDCVARVPGGIDTVHFAPLDDPHRMRDAWSIPRGAPVVGVVSRLRNTRGIPWLLEASRDFLARVPDARLVICGRGSYKAEMLERVAAHPHGERIHYAGYVTGDDLLGAYNAFDVGLLLKPGNDGACRSALEVMACGRPLIGGDFGAVGDLLSEPGSGWLVPLDDAGALADAVVGALGDRDALRAMGVAARQRVVSQYDESALAVRTLEFYERLMASQSARQVR